MKSLTRIIQWILGALGAGIALAGAMGIGASQLGFPGASIWPMPGLVLLDWAVLGLLGFVGLIAEGSWKRIFNLVDTWFVVGALIPMMVIGAFSSAHWCCFHCSPSWWLPSWPPFQQKEAG